MRPLTKWFLAGGAFALASAAAIPWPLTQGLQNLVTEHPLVRLAGLQSAVKGRVTFTLLPSPELQFSDISMSGEDGIEIAASQVTSKLRLFPLLAGKFESHTLSLIDPAISINLDTAGRSDRKEATTEANILPAIKPFGTIAIRNGKARLRGPSIPGGAIEITGIEAVFDWQEASAPAAVSGQGQLGGETIDVSLLLAKPGELVNAKASPFTFNLRSALGNLDLDADVAATPRWQIAGRLEAASQNMEGLQKAISQQESVFLPVQLARINAQTRLQASSLWLSDLQLQLDQNEFNGTITVQNDSGKANVTGTLAASKLNLDAYSRLIPDPLPETGWNQEPLQVSKLLQLNMDIRLSTGNLRVQHVSLSDVAMSSLAKDGRLELSLSTGKSYGGAVKARMSLNTTAPMAQLRTLVQFEGIDTAAFLRDAADSQRLSGAASGEIEIRTQGRSILEFVQNAQGLARANIGAGAINGLDLERAARQAQVQPLSVPAGLRNGRTPFVRSHVSASIEGGVMKLTKAGTESNELNVEYSGSVSLIARTLDVDITAARNSPASLLGAPGTEAVQQPAQTYSPLRLELTGPWIQPVLQLDAEGLIPVPADQHWWAQSRKPMDMIRHGCSTSLFQASQQWSRMSS